MPFLLEVNSEYFMPRHVDDVMTIGDLAEYLKISKSSLYKLCQEGKVPGQKVGRHWRFHKELIDNWLKQFPVQRDTVKKGSENK